MLRSIQHGKSHALHAVAQRLGLIGLLIAERIEALLATRQFVRIHIRRRSHEHDKLDDVPILIDDGGQLGYSEIASEAIWSERL